MISQNARNNIVKFDSEIINHINRVRAAEDVITKFIDKTVLKSDIWFEAIVNIITKDLD